MKRWPRFLGIDDSPFRFTDPIVRVVGVVTRGADYVEGVLSRAVTTDGLDATEAVLDMVGSSRFHRMLRAVFLNGVTLGGFNVVDLDAVHRGTGVPIVSVVRRAPDEERTRTALRAHFPDAAKRIGLLERQRPHTVRNGSFIVHCSARGVDEQDLSALLEAATVRGAIPEPIRLAHVIASGVARGESRGPA